jgi:hypothetical protein
LAAFFSAHRLAQRADQSRPVLATNGDGVVIDMFLEGRSVAGDTPAIATVSLYCRGRQQLQAGYGFSMRELVNPDLNLIIRNRGMRAIGKADPVAFRRVDEDYNQRGSLAADFLYKQQTGSVTLQLMVVASRKPGQEGTLTGRYQEIADADVEAI